MNIEQAIDLLNCPSVRAHLALMDSESNVLSAIVKVLHEYDDLEKSARLLALERAEFRIEAERLRTRAASQPVIGRVSDHELTQLRAGCSITLWPADWGRGHPKLMHDVVLKTPAP